MGVIFSIVLILTQSDNPSILSRDEKQRVCYSMAGISVATIEAHDLGVPLVKMLELADNPDIPESVRPIIRNGILKEYSEDAKRLKFDRNRLIDRFTAECLLNELPEK